MRSVAMTLPMTSPSMMTTGARSRASRRPGRPTVSVVVAWISPLAVPLSTTAPLNEQLPVISEPSLMNAGAVSDAVGFRRFQRMREATGKRHARRAGHAKPRACGRTPVRARRCLDACVRV